MKLLVTGGMGFIGSNFILYMLERNPHLQVINFDALTYAGNPDNVLEAEGALGYTFIKGDITDRSAVLDAMDGVDAVVHFAAESHVDRSIQDSRPFVYTNVLGTLTLLDAAKQKNVKRFIHVSTDEVYGSLGPTGLFTEETPLAPNSPYSASKAGSDLLARSYFHTYGFPVIITRCSNNYGPRQFTEKLIPTIITRALEDQSIPVYGDGLNIRDWLYVEDHCSALNAVLERGVPGEVYNIGGNQEKTNVEIVTRILQELGKSESLITYVADRLGHDRRYAIDATKIAKELGWTPSYDLNSGLRQTLAWYRDHVNWWKKGLEAE